MRRSQYRRAAKRKGFTSKRGIIAAAATLAVFGGIVTITQVSDASTRRGTQRALAACDNIQAPSSTKLSTRTKRGTYTTNGGTVTQHADDGAGDVPTQAQMRQRCRDWVMQNAGNSSGGQNSGGNNNGSSASPAPSGSAGSDQNSGGAGSSTGGNSTGGGNNSGGAATPPPGAGLGVLTNSCDTSKLPLHDGFQKGDRCVTTEFGEVGAAANNPSLLITQAPRTVGVNQPFSLQVSTRNLIRDRFLAAGKGGYYVESSVLQDGIVRGHFHTACRMLDSTRVAPAPDPVPAFFVATEDSKGGRTPDTVTINVPGLPAAGTAQCASWAGDGSHRIPMMERANQTPAFDAVRITVRNGGQQQGGQQQGGQQQGGQQQGGQQQGTQQQGTQQGTPQQ
jgi:hypothetical protein